jgi:Uma2 family endonuclease
MGLTITQNLPLTARRGWTREEFERLTEMGFFGPEERLELIEGEIVPKMTQNEPHATGVYLVQTALLRIFTTGYMVRVQLPLALGTASRPEPDIAVVTGSPRDYQTSPTTTVLVVEVSDTTLALDRAVKASLYASAGIPEYWIVNLIDRVLEVHRAPASMAAQPLGYGYGNITHLSAHETVAPLAAPQQAIAVADLLP